MQRDEVIIVLKELKKILHRLESLERYFKVDLQNAKNEINKKRDKLLEEV